MTNEFQKMYQLLNKTMQELQNLKVQGIVKFSQTQAHAKQELDKAREDGDLSLTTEQSKLYGNLLRDIADNLYAVKQILDLISATKSDLEKVQDIFQNMLAKELSLQPTEDGRMGSMTVRTEFTTATCSVRQCLPNPNPKTQKELYMILGRWMQIPENLLERGVVGIDWRKLQDYAAYANQQGIPYPEGLDLQTVYRQVSVTCRGKKDLMEDISNEPANT